MKKYSKKLTRSEVERHFIYIIQKYRDLFPKTGELFKIRIKKLELQKTIDNKNRIWLGEEAFRGLKVGDIVEITKNSDGSFTIEVVRK